jgi:hypothetical protein
MQRHEVEELLVDAVVDVGEAGAVVSEWRRCRVLRALRLVTVAFLLWQGAVAAWSLGRDVVTMPFAVIRSALVASDEERLRAALGEDAAIVIALLQTPPPSGVLFGRQVVETLEDVRREAVDEADLRARVEVRIARWRLLVKIRCLLMATTVFSSVPDPIAAVEAAAASGHDAWLLVIDGDEAPSGRPGWEQLVSNPRFSTWRFRKAS